jgi:hypothetical protein
VSAVRRHAGRVLRVARAAGKCAPEAGLGTPRGDACNLRGESRNLREPADPPGAHGARASCESSPGRTLNAQRRPSGPRGARVSRQGGDASMVRAARESGATDAGERPEPGLGGRPYVSRGRRPMVVPRSGLGSVFASLVGVAIGHSARHATHAGRGRRSPSSPPSTCGAHLSHRSRQRVSRRTAAGPPDCERHSAKYDAGWGAW